MNLATPTAALKLLGFSQSAIQRTRNYAKSARMSVPELVRECVKELDWQIAMNSRPMPKQKKGR